MSLEIVLVWFKLIPVAKPTGTSFNRRAIQSGFRDETGFRVQHDLLSIT